MKTSCSEKFRESQQIARTILEQLGGPGFTMLTGACNLVATGNGLRFFIGSGAKNGINRVTVTLNPADDYFVQFEHVSAPLYAVVSDAEGVYADQLQDVFEHHTGFYTTLRPRR